MLSTETKRADFALKRLIVCVLTLMHKKVWLAMSSISTHGAGKRPDISVSPLVLQMAFLVSSRIRAKVTLVQLFSRMFAHVGVVGLQALKGHWANLTLERFLCAVRY